MYAVIKTGGKQYRVQQDDVLPIEKLEAEVGDTITFDQVMMVGEGDKITLGAPTVKGATVTAEVMDQTRTRKILVAGRISAAPTVTASTRPWSRSPPSRPSRAGADRA